MEGRALGTPLSSRYLGTPLSTPHSGASTPAADGADVFRSQSGNHGTVADIRGELEQLVDMGDWEVIGPMGTYAEAVFKGKTVKEEEEVAIKVVSLGNQALRESKDVQEKLHRSCRGLRDTERRQMEESILRAKVLLEYTTTNHLCFKHIYCFWGIFGSSSTYRDKVLLNPHHLAHKIDANTFKDRRLDELGPFCFIVMENLSGRALQDYQWRDSWGNCAGAFGSLFDFDAAADATEHGLIEALAMFWSSIREKLPPTSTFSKKETEGTDTRVLCSAEEIGRRVLYCPPDGCFVHSDSTGARRIIIKCKHAVVDLVAELYPEKVANKKRLRRFGEQLRRFLCEHQVADSCGHCIDEDNQGHNPPFLLMSETFVRTVLKQTMLALAHAHGFSIYHSDLKPDNIMLLKKVHGHSVDEHDICVKIIDWGCSGFSKEDSSHNSHPFLPFEDRETGKLQPKGPKFDVYAVGNLMRWLFLPESIECTFDAENGLKADLSDENWSLYHDTRKCPNRFSQDSFCCPWMADREPLPIEFIRPFNPCQDEQFCHLLQCMLRHNADERFSASDVLQHPFILRHHVDPCAEVDTSHSEDIGRVNEILYKFVAPKHMLGLKRRDVQDMGSSQQTTHSVLELISFDIERLKKTLDVLVAVSLFERAPLARAFLTCGLPRKLGMLAREYHYVANYTQRFCPPLRRIKCDFWRARLTCLRRHLPRSAKLLAQIAGHQDRDMLRQILDVEQFEKQSRGDGRILFELMAYGTTVLDEEHRCNCLYFMAVMFGLSSADPPTEAQRELNISTKQLLYLYRVDGDPWSLDRIIVMFVELLETLTCSRQEALDNRKAKLKRLLQGPGLPNLHKLYRIDAQSGTDNDVDAAIGSLDDFSRCKSVSRELLELQRAIQPLQTCEHNMSFTRCFRLHFPDPDNIFATLHAKLWGEDERDARQSGTQSSKSDVLSCIMQALLNLIKICDDGDAGFKIDGLKCFIAGEANDCLFVRTMRRLQVLQRHHAPTFAKIFTRPLVEHVREKGGKEFWDKLAKQDEATKQFISDTWPADRDSDM